MCQEADCGCKLPKRRGLGCVVTALVFRDVPTRNLHNAVLLKRADTMRMMVVLSGFSLRRRRIDRTPKPDASNVNQLPAQLPA
jgi:hypothetical protein